MATTSEWIQGARPRTFPAAISPVAVGVGIAVGAGAFDAVRAALALLVALALQVGVNYSNDYSDGIRGTDEVRVGPVRLVGQKLAEPLEVKRAAFAMFGIAVLSGAILVLLTTQWWLVLVGMASVAAAWFYTGGSRPYGYAGFGEFFVFIFFGIVPVMGTAYVQTLTLNTTSLLGGIGVGAIACSILITNNLRDIPSDSQHGKLTLAVRLGDARTRIFFYVTIVVGFASVLAITAIVGPWALLAFASLPLAITPVRVVASGARGPALIPALKSTGILLLGFGVLLGLGIAIAGN